MRYSILVVCPLFILLSRVDARNGEPPVTDEKDDPPATDVEHFGKHRYCQFAFGGATDPKNFPGYDYIIYGQGHLLHHRLAFTMVDGLDTPQITITPDDGDDVWGVAYLVPLSEYEEMKKALHLVDGVVLMHSVIKTIEVDVRGETIKVKCNAFPMVTDPPPKGQETNEQKPYKDDLEYTLKCFRTAKLPPDYIEKISKLPTRQ